MKAWMIFGIVLCIIVLLGFLKVGIYLAYREDKLTFKVLVGKLRFEFGKENNKAKKKKDAAKAKRVRSKSKRSKKSAKPWIISALHHLGDILLLVGRVLTAPTLELLRLHILVGSSEPDESVLKYGRICSAVGSLLPALENTFLIKKRDVNVACSFDNTLQIDTEAVITLRIYEAIALVFAGLRLLIGMYQEINMNKKVVQNV